MSDYTVRQKEKQGKKLPKTALFSAFPTVTYRMSNKEKGIPFSDQDPREDLFFRPGSAGRPLLQTRICGKTSPSDPNLREDLSFKPGSARRPHRSDP
jgi:hypothetical protein